jgi:diguanylate cyclase (GGDEF)-like protein
MQSPFDAAVGTGIARAFQRSQAGRSRRGSLPLSRHGVTIRLLAVVAVLALFLAGTLVPLRDAIQDARFRLVQRPTSKSVVLVEIDAKSIAAKGQWPWSRALHGTIIDRLREAGATAVAFDIDFSSASTPDGDGAFEAALERTTGTSTLAVLASLQQAPSARDDGHKLISRPLPRFAAAWEASVDVSTDADGRTRSFARGEVFAGEPIPSMPLTLAGMGNSAGGGFLIDFGIDAEQVDRISAIDVIEGRFDPGRVRGKSVLVGATAVELRDFYQVPRYGTISGALLQILAAESLIQGRALQRTSIVFPVAACVLVLVLALRCRRGEMSVNILLCGLAAACVEAAATGLQAFFPQVLDTSPVHIELMAMAMMAVLLEIDARRVKMLESRDNANRLQVMLDRVIADSFTGIVVIDRKGTVLAVSRVARELLSLAGRDTAAISVDDDLPSILRQAVVDARQRAARGDWIPESPREAECLLDPSQPPSVLEFVTTVSHVPGATGTSISAQTDEYAICLTFQDVTERRRAQADIARLAHYDSLTGLANRHSFLSQVQSALLECSSRESGCLAVLSFDLDRFKLVNDRLGHSCGDALLKAVADRIRAVVQDGDCPARLGGDEFAMVLRRESLADARKMAEDIVASLSGAYEIGAYQVTIGASVGVALSDGEEAAKLLKRADAALYAAKAAGGDRVRLYDAALEETAEANLRLEEDLRGALQRGEFEVFYQRQVDASSEIIVGVEALLRWRHPTRGYVAPQDFIPLAERTGLVEEIGAWVLRTAAREAMTWPRPIKVSVNLSAVQLSRGDLVQTVADALVQTGLAPERLDLELTESLLMENASFARGTLDRIRQLGVGLSLDDFGTGYSSLAYLKTFDIDKIKIDRSFVRDLPEDQSSIAIIRAVVTLAQTLGLRVNTEGVETEAQLALLRAIGCDEVQGFLHGRAEPSAAIVASLLREQHRVGAPDDLRLAG